MKTLIFTLLFCTLIQAQDKRFTVFSRTELADQNTHTEAFDYGFNIGAGINYQMTTFYIEAEIYWFPALNELDYFHFQGTILGFNHHSFNERWRYSIGLIRPGLIIRDGGPHALFGIDGGIDYYFKNGNYLGIKTGYDWKEDSKVWGEEGHEVWYVSLKFGVTI